MGRTLRDYISEGTIPIGKCFTSHSMESGLENGVEVYKIIKAELCGGNNKGTLMLAQVIAHYHTGLVGEKSYWEYHVSASIARKEDKEVNLKRLADKPVFKPTKLSKQAKARLTEDITYLDKE